MGDARAADRELHAAFQQWLEIKRSSNDPERTQIPTPRLVPTFRVMWEMEAFIAGWRCAQASRPTLQ